MPSIEEGQKLAFEEASDEDRVNTFSDLPT